MKRNREKGVALLFTLFLLVFLLLFAEIIWSYYISTALLQRRYENTLQNIYSLKAAQTAAMWEEANAPVPNSWDTTATTACRLQGATISNKFYRLNGFNFRTQVTTGSGSVNVYAHAFSGTEAEPKSSIYLEYIYTVNTPLYKYILFSNSDLYFPLSGFDTLFDCYGGNIHTNENLYFNGDSYYGNIRFNQINQLSAAGIIAYPQMGYSYPAPHDVDLLDNVIDGMAPAPCVLPISPSDTHNATTTAVVLDPGPFQYKWSDAYGTYTSWKNSGDWLAYDPDWNSSRQSAWLWLGEDVFFYGLQFDVDPSNIQTGVGLTRDGDIVDQPYASPATLHRYPLSDTSGSSIVEKTGQYVYCDWGDNAFFRPYQDKNGNLNNDWYELPAGLPQGYPWVYDGQAIGDKYYSPDNPEQPVTFYATEQCAAGSAGCNMTDGGWRYIKTSDGTSFGSACETDALYNGASCKYVKAQDFTYRKINNIKFDDKAYFNAAHIKSTTRSKNHQFFNENYSYGNDWNNANDPNSLIYSFNTAKQPQGYQQYSDLLKQHSMDAVLQPGTRKDITLTLFDATGVDSPYKLRAQANGLYIDKTNVAAVITRLGADVAKQVSFYNWKTNKRITLIDLNVGMMIQKNNAPANGIIYTKYPIRLSNAAILPGANSANGAKAVFTVISEESVYLKGDYNFNRNDDTDIAQQWKVSNIATKKMIYTLSDAFNDPQTVPDFAIYLNYPYVKVRRCYSGCTCNNGYCSLPFREATSAQSGTWLTGYEGVQGGVSQALSDWILAQVSSKQTTYAATAIKPPNRVDKDYYVYSSLFITSWGFDDSLENWYYLSGGNEYQGEKYIVGSFLDLYTTDPAHPEYANYAVDLGAEENSWNYRGRNSNCNTWYIQAYGARLGGSDPYGSILYDPRFPQTTTNNPDATLNVTNGARNENSWRLITEKYFGKQLK